MILDDEESILSMLGQVLDMEGYDVVCMGHPREVKVLHAGAAPSLVLIDVMLPGTTGIEVARELRDRGLTTTPMIAMSASPIWVHRAEQSALFQGTLQKPFDIDTVIETVERYVA